MRIGISLYLLLLSVFTYAGTKVNFFKGSPEAAFQKAKEENKLVFVDFYASWCKPCKHLDKYTLKNKKLAKNLNKNYINLKIDVDEENPFFKKLMKGKIKSIPYLAFFTPDQQQIGVVEGFIEAAELIDYIQSMKKHFETGTDKKTHLEEKAKTIALGLCEDLDVFTKLLIDLNEVEEGSDAFNELYPKFEDELLIAKKVFEGLDEKIGADGNSQYFVDYLGKSLEEHCTNTLLVMQVLAK